METISPPKPQTPVVSVRRRLNAPIHTQHSNHSPPDLSQRHTIAVAIVSLLGPSKTGPKAGHIKDTLVGIATGPVAMPSSMLPVRSVIVLLAVKR